MSRRLAAVVAHPDDDTFGCAGTVAIHAADHGFRFVLIHVTSGERGMISNPALATRETLGAVREEEDRRSWIVLGREPDRHEFLRYPDGGVQSAARSELVDRLAGILGEERPDVVVTFGPEGITGHPDHIETGRASDEAFHRCRAETGEGFRRLLHVAIPAGELMQFNERLIELGREPMDPTQMFQPRGVPDETIGVVVDCSTVVDRKRAALREHRTQANDMSNIPEEMEAEILGSEMHVIAWPEREPGAPVLADVFADLE